jgi:hypothetical protein
MQERRWTVKGKWRRGRAGGKGEERAGPALLTPPARIAIGCSPQRRRRAHKAVQHRLQPPGRQGGRQAAPKAQPPALLRGGGMR